MTVSAPQRIPPTRCLRRMYIRNMTACPLDIHLYPPSKRVSFDKPPSQYNTPKFARVHFTETSVRADEENKVKLVVRAPFAEKYFVRVYPDDVAFTNEFTVYFDISEEPEGELKYTIQVAHQKS